MEKYNRPGNKYWVALDSSGKIVGGTGIGALALEGVCELQKMYCLKEISHSLRPIILPVTSDI